MAWTKEKRAEYMKKYRQEHREELNASNRYRYRLNLERERAKSRANGKIFYDRHKDDVEFKRKKNEVTKKWLANNRERRNAIQRAYYARKRADNEQRETD
jgi:hypothetical protein